MERIYTKYGKYAFGCALSIVVFQYTFSLWRHWPIEVRAVVTDLLLLTYFTWCGLFFQKRQRLGFTFFTIFFIALFLAVDLKYVFQQDWLKVSDFRMIEECFLSFPLVLTLPLTTLVLAPIIGILWNFQRLSMPRQLLWCLPALIWSIGTCTTPQSVLTAMEKIHTYRYWEGNSFFQKGVLFSLLYDVPRTIALKAKYNAIKSHHTPQTSNPCMALSATATKRNVHLFVLESLMDPVQMGMPLTTDPIDFRMRSWFGGSVLASTYGGGTAQAEFEMLCGTPVYDLAETIVFHNLRGGPSACLPRALEDNGYTALSTVAVPPSYYNYANAYRSMGFSQTYFQDAFPGNDKDGVWISNEEHVMVNKALIAPFLEQHTPILNYLITSSGHVEYELNAERRPPVLTTNLGEQVIRMINNLYYNSRTISDYIDFLRVHDPTAIIIVISDHQGYLDYMSTTKHAYWEPKNTDTIIAKYQVPYLFLDAGQKKNFGLITHYEIPHMILAALKGETYQPLARLYGFDLIRPMYAKTLYALDGALMFCPNPDDFNCPRLEAFHAEAIPRLLGLIEQSRK
jgi:hypothetical protein